MSKQPIKTVNANGTIEYRLNGMLHREDGPAVEWADGHKEWYEYGMLHRLDGPAIEWSSGNRTWFINGWCIKYVQKY